MNTAALDFHDFPATSETPSSLDTPGKVSIERVPIEYARTALKPQPSQKPGPEMMLAAAMGNAEAISIRNSWRFSHPIRTVTRAEFAEMTSRNQVVFHG